MFFSQRISLKALSALCRRLAIATKAGLEDRRVWRDEAEHGNNAQRQQLALVRDALARGTSIVDALEQTGDYFPPLFRQMAAVGELSGNLDLTYKRLADHYDRTLQAQRHLRAQLAWPLFQLSMAATVIGVLIWVMGIIAPQSADGKPAIDLLGLGLYGAKGLVVYLNVLVFLGIAGFLAYSAVRRGALWTRSLQRTALRLPVVGPALETLCLARLTWALQLVLDSPMDLRQALPLAFDAAGNDAYRRLGDDVVYRIGQGGTLATALAASGALPSDLLQAVAVGEEAGSLVETMQRQSAEYEQRAAGAIGLLAQILGYLVWVAVALLIIVLIFRIYQSYIASIQSLI